MCFWISNRQYVITALGDGLPSNSQKVKTLTNDDPVRQRISMMTLSNGSFFRLAGPVWGESTRHRWIPLTKASDAESFDIFFDLRLNKRFSKQSSRWWFETQSRSLWRTSMCWLAVLKVQYWISVSNFFILFHDISQSICDISQSAKSRK